MSSLFEDLKQGLKEAIEYEKGKGKAGVKTYSITPVKEYSGKEIREIRMKAGMTQTVFATYMGVSKKTVEAWETGTNRPIGPARRMISLIQLDPEILQSCHIVSENVV